MKISQKPIFEASFAYLKAIGLLIKKITFEEHKIRKMSFDFIKSKV